MAGKAEQSIEIVDRCLIPASTPVSAVTPLSFIDIHWIILRSPVQRLFFYHYPHLSLSHFTDHALPSLKRSLSDALHRFHPLAGSLVFPPPPRKPHIMSRDDDTVPFTTAVSGADFFELMSDRPQDAPVLYPLLPPFPTPLAKDDGTSVSPLLALQVTVFPNSGICIGVEFLHVAADGTAFTNFMKTWASICRAEVTKDPSCIEKSLPFLDRTIIKDPSDLESALLKQSRHILEVGHNSPNLKPDPSRLVINREEKLRATFTLTKNDIDRLKRWITDHIKQDQMSMRVSTFIAVSAYVWVCFVKSKEASERCVSMPNAYHFVFLVDCRERLSFENPVPKTYFGNCLDECHVTVKRDELVGKHGIISAARAIGATIMDLEVEGGLLSGAREWSNRYVELSATGCLLTVAGSPRLKVYDTDFGWGRPRKTHVVHIDQTDTFLLAESRDGQGGVEVGLALDKVSMDAFCGMFGEGLGSFLV